MGTIERDGCIRSGRAGFLGIFAMLALAAANPGCTCESSDDGGEDGEQPPGPPPGEAAIRPVAQGNAPFDATPDPDGKIVYFTAIDPEEGAGVFRVLATGGEVGVVSAGLPFVSPFGITISNDGKTLYVADASSETEDMPDEDDGGQILVLGVDGGEPTGLEGTRGYAPRGVEIGGADVGALYFTGRDPATGEAGVFSAAIGGGTVSSVAQGAPFADPSGVAVTKDGKTVFVADVRGSDGGDAAIFTVSGGKTDALATGLAVGYPAGVALSLDEATLYVSGLDPITQKDVVLLIDLASKEITEFTGDEENDFSQFEEPAGLHRAKNKDVFAWADSKAGEGGTVYVIGQ